MNEIYTDLEHNNNTKTITTFATGAIRDTSSDKEDYVETISYLALRRFAKYMTSKQSTYGKGNWRRGIPVESYEKSLMRHLQKYLANKYDGANLEPNEDHLAAALFNLQGLLHEQEASKFKKSISPDTNERIALDLAEMRDDEDTRKFAIRKLTELGYSTSYIATALGISERTVYRRLKDLKNG